MKSKAKPVAQKVEVGDVVYLRSGSERMTVVAVRTTSERPYADVMWSEYNSKQLRKAIFPVIALDVISKAPKPEGEDNG